jgi:predicted metal-dependent peptidase
VRKFQKVEYTNLPALKKFRKARAQVVQSHPFFGALLLQQQPIEAPEIPTMATDGHRVFYNPDYVMQQSPEYLRFDCAHEALHPALGHHVRRGARDPKMWNQACDYVINPMLVEAGLHIMDDALLRDDLKGLSADKAFNILKSEQPPTPDPDDSGQPQAGPGEPGEGDGESQPGGDQDQDQDGDQEDAQSAPGDDEDEGDQDQDGEGEGQDGDEGEPESKDSGVPEIPEDWKQGWVTDAPVKDETERQAEERDWKTNLVQAANLASAAPGAGNLPAGLVRELDAYLNPQASWEELLRRYMDQFAKSDFSWASPNRRFVANGIYLPSLKSDELPPILFVVDASGSMPTQSLHAAVSELQSIVDTMAPEYVDMIVHDTSVANDGVAERFFPGDQITSKVRAGGGTAFVPVCDWIDEHYQENQYALVIWFTDLGAWDWDDCVEPECPVLWVDYSPYDGKDAPPFGDDVIELPPEAVSN